MGRFTKPFLTLSEIQKKWPGGELSNDMITSFSVEITGHGGEIVSPAFHFARAQDFGWGCVTTANIGFIIWLAAQLFDLFEDDSRDFGKAIKNCPIRLYSWGGAGDIYMKTVCIGHFMKDRFVYGEDLLRFGIATVDGEAL